MGQVIKPSAREARLSVSIKPSAREAQSSMFTKPPAGGFSEKCLLRCRSGALLVVSPFNLLINDYKCFKCVLNLLRLAISSVPDKREFEI